MHLKFFLRSAPQTSPMRVKGTQLKNPYAKPFSAKPVIPKQPSVLNVLNTIIVIKLIC